MAEIEALLSARDKMSGVIRKAADNTDKHTGRMGKLFKGLGSVIGATTKAAAVGMAALGAGIVGTAVLAAKQEEAEAKLAATLKSMSAETWTSVEALKAHASALQGTSKFGDEAIIEMQGVLLTFGNITDQVGKGNDIFSQSTALILDMSEKLGTDLQGSSIQVGKALNDPIKGVTALTRVGVSFTEEQKKQIKTLQESGDLMGAQKIILGELEKQFGGTAAAAAEAGTGPFVQFKNIMGDIGEAVGRITLPILQDLAKWASGKGQKILAWFESDAGQAWVVRIQDGIRNVLAKFKEWGSWLSDTFKGKIEAGATPLQALLQTVQAVAGKLLGLIPASVSGQLEGFGAGLMLLAGPLALIGRELFPLIRPLLDAVIPPLAKLANSLAPALAEALNWLVDNVLPGFVTMLEAVIGWLGKNKGFVFALGIAGIAFKVFTAIVAVNPFVLLAIAVIAIASLIITNWDKITAFLSRTWDWIKGAASAVGKWISDAFKKAVDFLFNLFLNFTPLGQLIRNFDKIRDAATAVGTWIMDRFNEVVDFFKELPGRIGSAVAGMWDGIKEAFRAAINWIIGKWNDFKIQIGGASIPTPFGSINIPSVTLNTPNIPFFHQGGVFRAPTSGGEGLAVLKDRERVIPAGQSGTVIQIDVHIAGSVVSETQLVDAIHQGLIRRQRRTGALGFT